MDSSTDQLVTHHLSTCPCKQERMWCFHSLGSLHLPHFVAVIHFNLLYWLLFRLYWLTALSLITGPEFYVTAAQTQSTGQIMLIPSHTTSAASLTTQIGPAPHQGTWQEISFPPEATGFFKHFHLTSAVWRRKISSLSNNRTGPSVSCAVTILLRIISFYVKWYGHMVNSWHISTSASHKASGHHVGATQAKTWNGKDNKIQCS